jgi:dipeptidyl aminopeptidase/acylaminoacyl peptidase/mono/diheme cytochrome c family protein
VNLRHLCNLWILSTAGTMAVAIVALGVAIVSAQTPATPVGPPDFSRDVMPIFESNCLRCHNSAEEKGGLLLESYDDLMRGGDDGVPVVAGNADDSPMIRQLEARAKPKMPPKADLRPEDIATLRAWIAAGAKYSPARRASLDDKVPALPQSGSLLAEVPALGFSPDGGELAVAGYKEIKRFRVPAGASEPAFGGLIDQVRALAWSPDGKLLAAGGGTPGAFGELVLIDTATGSVARTLDGHRDYVYNVAFSPDGKRLASCGYDRQIRIWDTATGKPMGVLKEHTEAVYAVAFDPTGRLLASASSDRSVKIWDTAKGVRLYTINDPTDAVLTLAFRPGSHVLVAGGADKRLRAWRIETSAATLLANTLAHTGSIIRIAFSPDGSRLVSASTTREVKIWNAEALALERALTGQSDWVQSLAFSPDGRTLAMGRYDGTVSVIDPATGRRLQDLIRPVATAADARRGK